MEEKTKKRSLLRDIVACILPIVSLAAALGIAVFVFRRVDNSVTTAQAALVQAEQSEGQAIEQPVVYAGVEDPWIEAGSFTVGDEELDAYIRDFCKECSPAGATADEAAQATFNVIVDSTYLYRIDKPMGLDWVARSAKEYFTSDDGMGGHQGDVYEYASVLALCLRYFGFSDAIAVPTVNTSGVGDADGSALCLVTNSDGTGCVCDPAVGTAGWMLPRTSYDILVDDIGQNKDAALAMGLQIKEKYADDESGTTNGMDDESMMGGTGTTGNYGGTSGSGASGSSAYDSSDSSSSYGSTSGTGAYGSDSSTSSYGGYDDDTSSMGGSDGYGTTGSAGSSGNYGSSGGYGNSGSYGSDDSYDAYGTSGSTY